MTTVGVVLCTYNGSKYIEEQILSILNQSRPIDELVVLDDQSSDNTVDQIKQLIAQHHNLKTIIEVNAINLGYVRNFEKAALTATSDILFFADQDDVWHTSKIEKMLPFFENKNTWSVYHDGDLVDETGKNLGKTLFGTRRKAKLTEGMNRDIKDVLANIDINGCTMAVRNELIKNTPLPPKRNVELWGHDHWWALHAHALGGLHVLNEKLFSYRIHTDNASGKINTRFEFEKIKTIWKLAKSQGNDFYYERYLALEASIKRMTKRFQPEKATFKEFEAALEYFKQISLARKNMGSKSFWHKLKAVKKINHSGFYKNYLNGYATLFRDLFI